MRHPFTNAINNKEIPNYLSRSKNLSTSLDEPVKPKFTRSAKSKPIAIYYSGNIQIVSIK